MNRTFQHSAAKVQEEPNSFLEISRCMRSQQRVFCAGAKILYAMQRGFLPFVDFAAFLRRKQQKELCRMHGTGDYAISDLTEVLSVFRPMIYRTFNRNRC
jgi:hypothetical protein